MFGLSAATRILLFTGATDMRKGFDGLIALVMASGENVYSGNLYVFVSRRRNQARILAFQRGGLVLLCKRLDRGHFKISLSEEQDRAEIDSIQLTMLLDGIDFARVRRPPHWTPDT